MLKLKKKCLFAAPGALTYWRRKVPWPERFGDKSHIARCPKASAEYVGTQTSRPSSPGFGINIPGQMELL